MKKIKQIVLALVAAVTLFGCKSQVSKDVQIEPETINLRNIESAITEMEKTHQNAIQNLFDEISKSDFHELNRSIFFKEQNNNSRNESSSFDYLTDEEEDFIIENMTEEEKEVILQTVQFYLDEYAEIAKIRVFDTENKPEGLIETDDEIILGDIVFSKLTPEGLSQVYELAKTYYGVDIADRGAFLGTNPTPNSILMFKSGWVNNTIPYAFDGFPSNYKSDMRKCMKEWETGSANAIKFNEVKSFNWWRNIWWNLGTLKVLKISQEDLDKNVLGQATCGYCNRPRLYIDKDHFSDNYDSVMQTFKHELGHVIGLRHEFDRKDRDNYLIIDSAYSWSDISASSFMRNFIGSIGTFDYDSVMNYPGFYYIKNKNGTKGKKIEVKDILYVSDGDKAAVKRLYSIVYAQ